MKKYIINGPKTYPRQSVLRYCAMYTVQCVVEQYDRTKRDVLDYASSILTRWHGLMFPAQLITVLRRYGLDARLYSCRRLSPPNRIETLKTVLEKGYPIILLIGHAYYRVGEFSYRKAIVFQHYITVLGYDDALRIFYVYDSGKNTIHSSGIPVGNVAIPYDDMLRYWNRGGLGLYKNLMIVPDHIL